MRLRRLVPVLAATALAALPSLGCSTSSQSPCTSNAQCLGYDICRTLSGTTSGMCVSPYACNATSDCPDAGSPQPWECKNNQCVPVSCLRDSGCD